MPRPTVPPPFPVINALPRFRDAFLYLRGSDLTAGAAMTTAGEAVNYFSALPKLCGRYSFCLQIEEGRLLRFKDNERLVALAYQVVAERERRAKVGLAAAAH